MSIDDECFEVFVVFCMCVEMCVVREVVEVVEVECIDCVVMMFDLEVYFVEEFDLVVVEVVICEVGDWEVVE